MNKTLINIKNLLKIIISCFVLISMIKSCSMAYSFEQFKQFLDACYEENITTIAMSNYDFDVVLNNWYKIENVITQKNLDMSQYTCFAIRGSGKYGINRDNFFEVWCFKSAPGFGYQTGGSASYFDIYANSGTIKIFSSGSLYNVNPGWNNNFKCGIFENTTTFTESAFSQCLSQEKWNPDNHPLKPPFNFTPYNIEFINDHNILKFSYVGNVGLGLLGENDFYQLQVRLKDSSLTTLGTLFFDENQHCYSQDNALLVENDTRILANTVYLSYYEPYYLEFTIYSDSTNYEIQGHLYKFYPMNAVIENGQIVSPGSGDYTNQNQTIDIIGGVVGELPSGDSPGSGILGGIARLFIPSSDFFLNYFTNLNNWLTDHLGFLYAPFSIVFDLLNRIIAFDFSDPMVEFGPFTLPLNDNMTLVNHYEYHFNDLLNDSNFSQIHNIYLLIIDGILILGFLYMLYCKYKEIFGGGKK